MARRPLLALCATAGPAAAQIPPVVQDLTGCWEQGASNGKPPAAGCGVALTDGGDGLLYMSQKADGTVDACLSQSCYRPATGLLTNTSSGAGMLRMRTLTDKGNCTRAHYPGFPADGLLESFNFILPPGWPAAGSPARGTHVAAADLSGVFVNNGHAGGTAGAIFLSRRESAACDHMRALADCTAVPPASPPVAAKAARTQDGAGHRETTPACTAALEADCGSQRGAGSACMRCLEITAHHADIKKAGCTPPDVQAFCGSAPGPAPAPLPPPPETERNTTGCYRFHGSAGQEPAADCGMAPASSGTGYAYVSHRADASVKVCLHQFCSRLLHGNYTTASNGVGFMLMETDFGVGNCTCKVGKNFPCDGLFAHIDFVVPAGWPQSAQKTVGTATDGAHTLSGMFVNNGPALAGYLQMDPDVDPSECNSMRELPFCADFVPPVP